MTRPSSASSLIIFRDVDQSDTAAAPMLPVDYALERMRAEEAAAERSASGAAHDVHQ